MGGVDNRPPVATREGRRHRGTTFHISRCSCRPLGCRPSGGGGRGSGSLRLLRRIPERPTCRCRTRRQRGGPCAYHQRLRRERNRIHAVLLPLRARVPLGATVRPGDRVEISYRRGSRALGSGYRYRRRRQRGHRYGMARRVRGRARHRTCSWCGLVARGPEPRSAANYCDGPGRIGSADVLSVGSEMRRNPASVPGTPLWLEVVLSVEEGTFRLATGSECVIRIQDRVFVSATAVRVAPGALGFQPDECFGTS